MTSIPSEKFRARIKAAVEYLATVEWGADYKAIAEDSGCRGRGLCHEASSELQRALSDDSGVVMFINVRSRPFKWRYPDIEDGQPGGHYVLVLADHDEQLWAVDLTARQFDDSLPFPYYWRWM